MDRATVRSRLFRFRRHIGQRHRGQREPSDWRVTRAHWGQASVGPEARTAPGLRIASPTWRRASTPSTTEGRSAGAATPPPPLPLHPPPPPPPPVQATQPPPTSPPL